VKSYSQTALTFLHVFIYLLYLAANMHIILHQPTRKAMRSKATEFGEIMQWLGLLRRSR